MNRKSTKGPQTDSIQYFRQSISKAIAKLGDSQTSGTGIEEIKEIMRTQVNNTEKMNILLSLVSEQNDHMKLIHKREIFKIFGFAGEIFEDALLPFLNKIFTICHKRMNEAQLHPAISDSIGVIIQNVFKNIKNSEDHAASLATCLFTIISFINNAEHQIQIGASMSLTRAIQNCPIEPLSIIIGKLSNAILDLLKSPSTKSTHQLLESLISLILAVEQNFEPYSIEFIPILKENLENPDWMTRKMAIDVFYTYGTFLPNVLKADYSSLILQIKNCRFDKVKQVREAASETIKKLKEIFPEADEESKKEVLLKKESKSIFQGPSNAKFFHNKKEDIQILTTPNLNNEALPNNNNTKTLNIEDDKIVNAQENYREEVEQNTEEKIMSADIEKEKKKIQNDFLENNKTPEQNLHEKDVTFEKLEKIEVPENENLIKRDISQKSNIDQGKVTKIDNFVTISSENANSNGSNLKEMSLNLSTQAKQLSKISECFEYFQKCTNQDILQIKEKLNYFEDAFENLTKTLSKSLIINNSESQRLDQDSKIKTGKEIKKEGQKNDFWSMILKFIQEGKLNNAYEAVLMKNDIILLIKLLGKTGIVIELLEDNLNEELLNKIVEIIQQEEFVSFLIPWLVAFVDRRVKISQSSIEILIQNIEILISESDKYMIEEYQIFELNRSLNKIKSVDI